MNDELAALVPTAMGLVTSIHHSSFRIHHFPLCVYLEFHQNA
jgi:hypothetical protein